MARNAGTDSRTSGSGPGRSVSSRVHVALYPGSFDPPTFGHLDVIRRGRRLFDRLVVGIGRNPEKRTLFTDAERHSMLATLVAEIEREEPEHAPVEVQMFEGLTIDFARSVGATVLLRGIRNLSDLQAEVQQAVTNREVAGIESAFVVAGQSFAYTSSTLIRQIAAMGDDLKVLAPLCPALVIEALRRKKVERPEAFRLLAQ